MSDNHPVEPPARPEDGYHLADDLSAKAIEFIQDSKVINPDKPFFMYFAPQAGHAPHLVPLEWADRYKGVFDAGYEAMRPEILARQVELGLLPPSTVLSEINPHGEPARTGPNGEPWPMLDTVRPWESLSDDEKRLFVRMAEVFAGYISYYDDRLGRIIDYLDNTGELDNTLIVVVSDNGSSGEGGPNGTFNEWRFFNGLADSTDLVLEHIDELGTPASNNHYNTGWAWALDTPFPYWKRWAGYEGGTADMCLVSWPAKIEPSADVRHQYVHAVDVVPTVYDLLGITPPPVINGYEQLPMEGESFAAALTDPSAPGKSTQFYTMLGQRAIYHEGWLACTVHPPLSSWGHFEDDEWELFHLEVDRAQATNLAAQEPERLAAMTALWFECADKYNGLPLDDRSALEQVLAERPRAAEPRAQFVFFPGCSDVPESAGPMIPGRSYSISAGVVVEEDPEGVLWAAGGVAGGHSLYVKDGRLRYTFNWVGTFMQDVIADAPLTPGSHVCVAEFVATGKSQDPHMPGAHGTLTLYVDDAVVASGEITTQPGYFCLTGDGISVGRDSGSAVTPEYAAPFEFTGGTIDRVVVDLSGDRYVDHEAQVRGWFLLD